MLKLILFVAAAAALAVAAPSVPDFLDVHELDLDDGGADDLLEDMDNLDDEETQNSLALDDPEAGQCINADIDCKNNEFISFSDAQARCTPCNEEKLAPYGNFKVCGRGQCSSCPLNIDKSLEICVTSFQEKVLLGQTIPRQDNSGKTNLSPLNETEVSILAKKPYTSREILVTNGVSRSTNQTNDIQVDIENTENETFLEMASCAGSLTCCLPGYYGASSSSCTECPSNKPSSPFSAPNSNCECPNAAASSCFACTNKCRPYDSRSRMCLPKTCPGTQTCRPSTGQCV
jgi:hypothetical protein